MPGLEGRSICNRKGQKDSMPCHTSQPAQCPDKFTPVVPQKQDKRHHLARHVADICQCKSYFALSFQCTFVFVFETTAPRDADRYETLHKQGSRLLYELDPEIMHLSLRNKQKAVKLHDSKITNMLANLEIEVPNSF